MDDPFLSAPGRPTGAPDGAGEETSPTETTERTGQDGTGALASPAGGAPAAAGEALRALAHVARSFVLYDAANERIRGFLEDARAKVEEFLKTFGEMRLEVRPWDIVLGGTIVYSDRDRERSLAFRLYRDGVRRITIRPELEWTELIVLIGILSIRYKGVRTQEDDVVTLLWRADFAHIEVGAVEGLVASEDFAVDVPLPTAGAAAGPRDAMQAMIYNAPFAFDYPWPEWTERAAVERRPVSPDLLTTITGEEGANALSRECLQLVRELLAAISDPHDPLSPGEVTPALYEIRGFLVGDLCLDALLGMARMVHGTPAVDDDVRNELLAACLDDDALHRLTVAVDPTDAQALATLAELAQLVPGDHVSTLLDLYTSSPRYQGSPAVRHVLENQLKGRTSLIVERLGTLHAVVAIELFRMVVRADPTGSVDVAIVLLGRPEPMVQLEATRALDAAEYSGKIGRALVGALGSDSSDVRLQALATLVRRRERRAFDPLTTRLKSGAIGLAAAEAREIGEAMARLDPDKARTVFKEWVRPAGLLGRMSAGQTMPRWAAVAGLALLPGGESEDLLQWLSRHAGDDLAQQCEVALDRLRDHAGGDRAS